MAEPRKRPWTTTKGEVKFAWQVPYKDLAGKRRHKQFSRWKDADAFRKKVERELFEGTHVADRATVTFEQACKEWLELRERQWRIVQPDGSRKPSGRVLDGEKRLVRRHLVPQFGALRVTEITFRAIQVWGDGIAERYFWDGVPKQCLRIMRQVLNHAVDVGHLRQSPLNGRRIDTKLARFGPEPAFPTPTELGVLWRSVQTRRPHEQYDAWRSTRVVLLLAICTGMRAGEIRGLFWEDIDFDTNVIRVQRAERHKLDGLGPPKSKAGKRVIPMAPHLRAELLEYGDFTGRSSGRVLLTRSGRVLLEADVYQRVRRAIIEAGLTVGASKPKFSLHKIRHTVGSILYRRGTPMLNIMQMMGWANEEMFYRVYGHVFEDDETVRTNLTHSLDGFLPKLADTPLLAPPFPVAPASPAMTIAGHAVTAEPEPDPEPDPPARAPAPAAIPFDPYEPPRDLRKQALEMRQRGMTREAIGLELGVSASRVGHWLRHPNSKTPATWECRYTETELLERVRGLLVQGEPRYRIMLMLRIGPKTADQFIEAAMTSAGAPASASVLTPDPAREPVPAIDRRDPRQTARYMYEQGMSIDIISRRLGITTSLAYNWVRFDDTPKAPNWRLRYTEGELRERVRELLARGLAPWLIALELRIGRATVRTVVRELEAGDDVTHVAAA